MELLEHNKKAFDEIMASYKVFKDVCYVSGVGTGKTYVFMAVASNIDGRILYVYPKHMIGDNVKSYNDFGRLASRVDFITYNAFKTPEIAEYIISMYSLIVIDECHHMTSDLYGNNLSIAITECSAKVLGLTATPVIRGKDCRELFEKVVVGLSNVVAIKEGLMSTINYELCLKEVDESLIKSMLFEDVEIKLDMDTSFKLLSKIIRNLNISKWITFYKDYASLLEYKKLIEKLFPSYDIVVVMSFMKDTKSLIRKIQTGDNIVVMCCDMLSEGMHIDNVRGIILFRNVRSSTLFKQIIGRVCRIGYSESPTVIDCSECAYRLLRDLAFVEMEYGRGNQIEKYNRPIVNIGINRSISIDIVKLLSNIDDGEGFNFQGKSYSSIESACVEYNIVYEDVLKFRKQYKMSLLNAFVSVLNRSRFLNG